MMMLRWLILLLMGLNFSTLVSAAPIAVVEAVQEKAAYQREGKQEPLKKGIELRNGDIITTGAKSRVAIRFWDSSLVRLGAHARVSFERLIPPTKPKSGTLTGLFNVLEGIFRFTSNKKPQVEVLVGNTIAIGIRGTDVYALAQADKDLVCLIEGAIQVQAGEVKTMLTQPREGFIVPKGQPPLPVSLIPEDKFQKWLENTELQ